ncbi:MAG: argininosuccinate lyase [Deltaproteobacteria bacterium]|nr:argininosuccinate lyase [Deltaproteobacteria bacterium]
MSKKISQIWGNHFNNQPDEQNVLFCAGRDVKEISMADQILLPFDIWTNRAHCIMLYKQEIISTNCLEKILTGLLKLENLFEEGQFSLDPDKEDVHINVEDFVTEDQGKDIGGRMHIGRSRNDQTACDMRLYLRSSCLKFFFDVRNFTSSLLILAQENTESVMPGFTHYQPAMVTSWGHWICSYIQGLCRDLERLAFSLSLINRNPLGAGAAFGTSWPIDRALTTELLAFEKIDLNTLDSIVSRWENEAQLAHSITLLMNHLSIVAQDLIFLSHPYVGMIQIEDKYLTGSSIMPQKKNPDFAEIIKSKASLAQGMLSGLLGIQKGAVSGYNRDTQTSKYLIMDLVRECEQTPLILQGVFESLKVNHKKMKELSEIDFMNATDIADYLASKLNLPFRECYNLIANSVKLSAPEPKITTDALRKSLEEYGQSQRIADDLENLQDPLKLLQQRLHHGSPSPEQTRLQLKEFTKQLNLLSSPIEKLEKNIHDARESCRNYEL